MICFKGVKVGQTFEWCGLKFVKLKNGLSLICNISDFKGKYCIFDPYDNNYECSLIRQYINGKFLNINNIVTSELDYVYENIDYATLLSKEEYEENKYIITRTDYWYWLRSPDADSSDFAYVVDDDGDIGLSDVNYNNLAVRAVFNLKSDTKVSIIE